MLMPSPVSLDTRFGTITVEADQRLTMPAGMPGFDGRREFALVDFPDQRFSRFRLLQSIEDKSLSFITLPADEADVPMADEDCAELARAVGAEEAVELFFVVTLRGADNGVAVSANLRAPVVVDGRRRVARQVVLSNPAYAVRHLLAWGGKNCRAEQEASAHPANPAGHDGAENG